MGALEGAKGVQVCMGQRLRRREWKKSRTGDHGPFADSGTREGNQTRVKPSGRRQGEVKAH